jgi:hypothetical protein
MTVCDAGGCIRFLAFRFWLSAFRLFWAPGQAFRSYRSYALFQNNKQPAATEKLLLQLKNWPVSTAIPGASFGSNNIALSHEIYYWC